MHYFIISLSKFVFCVSLFRPSDFGVNHNMKDFLQRMEEFARDHFRFHRHIQAAAEETLRDVSSARLEKSSHKSTEVTFVGIHNRRTDHLKFAEKIAGVKPIKKSYFKDAMEYFRWGSYRAFTQNVLRARLGHLTTKNVLLSR